MWMTASSPKSDAAFGVIDVACVEEEHCVGRTRVDVKRAGLASVAEHLQHAGKIVMRQAAAEARVGLREHLRRLEAFGLADDDVSNVRRDDRGLPLAVDVVVATRLESFHQSALAAVTKSDDWQVRVLGVGLDDGRDFESAHVAHVCRANDGCGRVVFERRQARTLAACWREPESLLFSTHR